MAETIQQKQRGNAIYMIARTWKQSCWLKSTKKLEQNVGDERRTMESDKVENLKNKMRPYIRPNEEEMGIGKHPRGC